MGPLCGAPRKCLPAARHSGLLAGRRVRVRGLPVTPPPSTGAVLRAPPAQAPSQLHYLPRGSSHGSSPTRSLSCSTALLGADQPLTAGPLGRPAFAPTPWHSGSSARVPSPPSTTSCVAPVCPEPGPAGTSLQREEAHGLPRPLDTLGAQARCHQSPGTVLASRQRPRGLCPSLLPAPGWGAWGLPAQ